MTDGNQGNGQGGIPLNKGWRLTTTPAGEVTAPDDLGTAADWLDAPVPGTVAGALEAAGRFDRNNPVSLENVDAWYVLELQKAAGPAILRFAGLATIAEVYLNGNPILNCDSMFEAHEVPVDLTGKDVLALCFRALGPRLNVKGPRARWRPAMMRSQGLRLIRTTTLGFMPGWCPDIVAVGPWREISLIRPNAPRIEDLWLRSSLSKSGQGLLQLSFKAEYPITEAIVTCAGAEARLSRQGDRFEAELVLADIKPWWPHTHGEPKLYPVSLNLNGRIMELGQTGFRRVEIDRGKDGQDFALVVNGEHVFCRGAVWTNADIVNLPGTRDAYEPFLQAAADAGMNMIRIGGTMAYETPAFFRLCDELGLLVWQDLMLANFDYPASDDALMIHVKTELTQLLQANSASPSLAVLCGGSEMHQQGAMLGLPASIWNGELTREILPSLVSALAPDLPFVANSPSGGAQPFFPNAGVGHYYGVGAYMRPLEDARRANVRFAAECLAFSHVPEPETLEKHLPVPAVHHPSWKARVPRDLGASWDFEDVRDHYLSELYSLDAARLRREDPERYLIFSRAVTAEVMEATFAEWRRPGSTANGAMIWTLQDLLPGAGWGVIDSTGRPKSAWYALKRAFGPLQVLLSDEGTNGLDVHVINETSENRSLMLQLSCLRDGHQPVLSGKRELELAARGTVTLAATDLFGAFFDATYAYRFGPPSHDVTHAQLIDLSGQNVMAEAFHFPQGRAAALHDGTVELSLTRVTDDTWAADISTNRLMQNLSIHAAGFRPRENYFHLAPGKPKRVLLTAEAGQDTNALPSGYMTSLGSRRPIHF